MNALTRWACVLAPCLLNGLSSAAAIDLGDASVLSQQGQKLKVAVPYGSAPGERVPALRFSVASVTTPDGQPAVPAGGFTISKPVRRNVVYLQSSEPVHAARLKLVLQVAGSEPGQASYDLAVPPARFTPVVQAAEPSAAHAPAGSQRRGARKPPRVKPGAAAAQGAAADKASSDKPATAQATG